MFADPLILDVEKSKEINSLSLEEKLKLLEHLVDRQEEERKEFEDRVQKEIRQLIAVNLQQETILEHKEEYPKKEQREGRKISNMQKMEKSFRDSLDLKMYGCEWKRGKIKT